MRRECVWVTVCVCLVLGFSVGWQEAHRPAGGPISRRAKWWDVALVLMAAASMYGVLGGE